ncbi:MAG: hypothetical protein SF028_09295 [Candidatus Sumerlaeia bacterium]|nr:hypothetical protein [Candidatus Sumerlaeia bacterium]
METAPPAAAPRPASPRKRIIAFHVALASFFFPVAIMFLVTGALYTLSIRGGYQTETIPVGLEEPLTADLPRLHAIAEGILRQQEIDEPTGGYGVKKAGTSFEFEWTGANADVVLRPTADPLAAELLVKKTTPYRRLVQLHKAKGSDFAKGVSVLWAAGLLALFASGAALSFGLPAYRPLAFGAGALGLLTFLAYVLVG